MQNYKRAMNKEISIKEVRVAWVSLFSKVEIKGSVASPTRATPFFLRV